MRSSTPALLLAYATAIAWPLLFPQQGTAAEEGLPYYTEYRSERHFSHGNLGSLVIAPDGSILALAQSQLYHFDGRIWTPLVLGSEAQNHPLENIRLGADGTLLATVIGDFGRLRRVSSMEYVFESLLPDDPADDVDKQWQLGAIAAFDDGSAAYMGRDGVVVARNASDYRWWRDFDDCRGAFELAGRRYFLSASLGLLSLEPDRGVFEPVAASPDEDDPFDVCAVAGAEAWLGTEQGEFYRFDGRAITRVYTEIDDLSNHGIADLQWLPAGELAVAINGAGIFILSNEGRLRAALRREHDRVFSEARQLELGPKGMLWACCDHAIVKIRIDAPLSFFDARFDLDLDQPNVLRFGERLVLQSGRRLYGAQYTSSRFLKGFEQLQLYGLSEITALAPLPDGTGALVSNGRSLYEGLADGNLSLIARNASAQDIVLLPDAEPACLALCRDGVALFRKSGGQWREVGPRFPYKTYLGNPVFDRNGAVWLEGGISTILRVDPTGDALSVTEFRMDSYLPAKWVNLWKLGETVYASAGTRIVALSEDSGFRRDPVVDELFASFTGWIQRPVTGPDGAIYVPRQGGISILRPQDDGSYARDDQSLALHEAAYTTVHIEDELVYLISRRSVTRYDPSRPSPPYALPRPKIENLRRVSAGETIRAFPIGRGPLEIPYSDADLTADFFADDFHMREQVRFQTRLEGLSPEWSTPFWEPFRDLRGLRGGHYILRVRTVDHLGRTSPESSLSLAIIPPFYRSPFAYALYVIAAALLTGFAGRRYAQQQLSKRRQLEDLVLKRTAELDHALQTARAASQAKSEFLANMSHELRTPMNAVIGIAQLMAHTELTETQKSYLKILESSSSSLLFLIDDILDLSRIQAARIELAEREMSLVEAVESALQMVRRQAEQKGIELSFWMDEESCRPCVGDPQRIQQILINLLSNAIKFTLAGEVRLESSMAAGRDGAPIVRISVTDTGIGIPESKIDDIFQAFTQVDSSNSRRFGGSGLGLAISKNLAQLMGGDILIESVEGEGSVFSLELPLRPATDRAPRGFYRLRDRFAGRKIAALGLHPSTDESLAKALRLLGVEARDRVEPGLDAAIIGAADAAIGQLPPDLPQIRLRPLESAETHLLDNELIQHLAKPIFPDELNNALQTTFRIRDEQAATDSATEPQVVALKPTRVLLAEDQPANQSVLSRMLGHLGYASDIVATGEEAIEAARTGLYPVILMDLQMPNQNGYDATQAIRSDPAIRHQPYIIAQTAAVFAEDRARAFAAGADHLITKPIKIAELAEALATGIAHGHPPPADPAEENDRQSDR